jgi:branched-chain amino acid transport system substrate-binding protein
MKTVKLLSLVAVLAILAQLHGTMPVQAQGGTINIYSQSPLSGGQSVLGTAISNGTRLAIEQLSGPIEKLGFKLAYVPKDDQADPKVGPANAADIVSDKSAMGVIGHLNSGVAIPSSVVYNDNDLVMISPANTNVKVTDRGLPTVNRVCGRDDAQGSAGANFAIQELKIKSAYIIHDKTAYGQGVAEFFRQGLEAGGVQVKGFEGTEETSNFDAILTPILAQSPDLIYFGGIYNQAAVFFKQARDKGVKSQFMGPDGMDSSDMAKIAGDASVGLVYTSAAGPVSVFPDAKQFADDYKKRFSINPEPYAAESYASTQILLAAIEKAIKDNGGKMPDRKTVAANVRATKGFKTIIGTITFDANGDPEVASYYILKVGSPDPANWGKNELIFSTTAKSPLALKAGASATMAATAAK